MNGQVRPTARQGGRFDVSPAASSASAAPASSEDLLMRGYRNTDPAGGLETRPCACGGIVTADPDAPGRGVAAHQFTGRHKAWRANQEDAE